MDNVRCLNEHTNGAGRSCLRPLAEKMDRSKFVESDADEQLILFVPFTADVKLKSIVVMGEGGEQHPRTLKVFKNRNDIDFDNVDSITPLQEWDLNEDVDGRLAYETRLTKFQNVQNLTLYFPDNFGADTTKIYYIEFRGLYTKVTRESYITIGEFAANPADHKTEAGPNQVHKEIS
eukprot:m.123028 g.123028  ORF g.123028 m.123028 type:complete len:177 (-) comp9638_c0_seq3:2404-2934(-)